MIHSRQESRFGVASAILAVVYRMVFVRREKIKEQQSINLIAGIVRIIIGFIWAERGAYGY